MSEPYGQYPQTPQMPDMPQAYGQPYPIVLRDHPQGTTILVLGILGLVTSGLFAPFAWYLGSRALRESRASGVAYANQQSIVIGRVLGMVMTILAIVAIIFFLLFLVVVMVAAAPGSR